MSKVKARAKVPKEASIDEVIEVKTLLRHPMHSGRMKDSEGRHAEPVHYFSQNVLELPSTISRSFLYMSFRNVFSFDL